MHGVDVWSGVVTGGDVECVGAVILAVVFPSGRDGIGQVERCELMCISA